MVDATRVRNLSKRTTRLVAVTGALVAGLGLSSLLPAAPASAVTAPRVYVSTAPQRSDSRLAQGALLSGPAYFYVARSADAADAEGIARVAFSIDRRSVSSDAGLPFDLAGDGPDGAAAYDLSALRIGRHTITASVLSNGRRRSISAGFMVVRPPAASDAPTTTTTTTAPPADPLDAPAPSTPTPVDSGPTTGVASRAPRFASGSFWYQALSPTAPLHPSSAALVANFNRQWHQYYNNVSINTDRYAPPIYVADAGTPLRTVRFWDCQNKGWLDPAWAAQMLAVPVPDGAQPSAGTDNEMVISQPSTDTIWELWQARWASDGQLEACWGGRLTNVSQSIGSFAWPFGTTAAGLSLTGGMITPEELAAGHIDHALSVALVETKRGEHSWPANRDDGWMDGADAIPEGLRFRLDPTIDVDALNIAPAAKIIAKALQTYGMVVRDTSGAVVLYAENTVAEGRGDPYPGLFGGAPSYSVLNGLPWDRLQALPVDYGKP